MRELRDWLIPMAAVLVTIYFFPADTWLGALALIFTLAAGAALEPPPLTTSMMGGIDQPSA